MLQHSCTETSKLTIVVCNKNIHTYHALPRKHPLVTSSIFPMLLGYEENQYVSEASGSPDTPTLGVKALVFLLLVIRLQGRSCGEVHQVQPPRLRCSSPSISAESQGKRSAQQLMEGKRSLDHLSVSDSSRACA